jgi:hypothetical protein
VDAAAAAAVTAAAAAAAVDAAAAAIAGSRPRTNCDEPGVCPWLVLLQDTVFRSFDTFDHNFREPQDLNERVVVSDIGL